MEEKEVVKSGDVGSMEEVFGKDDSMFQPDAQNDGVEEDRPGKTLPAIYREHEAKEDVLVNEVDLTASQIEETTETEAMKEANVPNEYPVDPVEPFSVRKKDIPEEVEITHLKHPITGHIFGVNDIIIKQRHLLPCTEEGKLVHDNRIFNRFN
jgi:hypothetical protein